MNQVVTGRYVGGYKFKQQEQFQNIKDNTCTSMCQYCVWLLWNVKKCAKDREKDY